MADFSRCRSRKRSTRAVHHDSYELMCEEAQGSAGLHSAMAQESQWPSTGIATALQESLLLEAVP
jgi:hypothetical protein